MKNYLLVKFIVFLIISVIIGCVTELSPLLTFIALVYTQIHLNI